MDFFKKKFRVKLDSHPFGYIIKYAEYRFFPIWHTLEKWVDYVEPNFEEYEIIDGDWEDIVFNAGDVYNVFRSLNTMEDVKKYYKSIINEKNDEHPN